MAIRLPHDKIPQDDNLVAGMTSLRFKSSLKPAEPPYKRELFEQQRGRCNGCQTEFEYHDLVVDHIVPVTKGGGWYSLGNLQLLCRRCNEIKANGAQEDLIARLQELGIVEVE